MYILIRRNDYTLQVFVRQVSRFIVEPHHGIEKRHAIYAIQVGKMSATQPALQCQLAPGSAAASARIKMLTNDGKLLINSLFLPVIRAAAIGNSGSRHGHLLFHVDRGTVTSVIGAVLSR